jgi:hypothetical protein
MKDETNMLDLPAVLKMELDLTVEELEQKVAPGHNLNHNETLVRE